LTCCVEIHVDDPQKSLLRIELLLDPLVKEITPSSRDELESPSCNLGSPCEGGTVMNVSWCYVALAVRFTVDTARSIGCRRRKGTMFVQGKSVITAGKENVACSSHMSSCIKMRFVYFLR